jgi:hypothetical protein
MPVFYPGNSYTYLRALTPNDTPGAASLLEGAKYLHNAGVAGTVTVTQNQASSADGAAGVAPSDATVVVYIGQGDWVEVGAAWRNVNATGTSAGALKAAH